MTDPLCQVGRKVEITQSKLYIDFLSGSSILFDILQHQVSEFVWYLVHWLCQNLSLAFSQYSRLLVHPVGSYPGFHAARSN